MELLKEGGFFETLLDKARSAGNGEKFRRLYDRGDWQGTGHSSWSEADASLLAILAFWTGPNAAVLDHLFCESKLMRDKAWKRPDYLDRTIAFVLKGKTEFYDWNATVDEDGKPKKPARIKKLADAIAADNHFAQDVAGRLYRFDGGVYRQRAEQFIKQNVKRLVNQWGTPGWWSTRLANEVVEYLRVDSPHLWERPPADVVNVLNGLLDVRTRERVPHSHEHLSPVQLPVKYDKTAKCPATEKFIGEVFPNDAATLAWEIAGWLMVPYTSIQKAILLTGEGDNGKSTWLTQLTAFIGTPNTASVPLHKIESDKFAAARLLGRLANICADLPDEHLKGTSMFKAITGGDAISAECKFRDSFDFVPYARLVFSANSPPESDDSSHAFFRRWIVVPFELAITADTLIPGDVLNARLAAPAELSGLLNHALDGLERIREQKGFTEPKSVREAFSQFRATTDPLAVWLDQYTVDGPEVFVPCTALRGAYNAAAEQSGRRMMTKTAFGRAIKHLRKGVETKQLTVHSGCEVQWCYVGLGMTHGLHASTAEPEFT